MALFQLQHTFVKEQTTNYIKNMMRDTDKKSWSPLMMPPMFRCIVLILATYNNNCCEAAFTSTAASRPPNKLLLVQTITHYCNRKDHQPRSSVRSAAFMMTMNASEEEEEGEEELFALPTMESIQNDPFMKQVEHGAQLTSLLMMQDYSYENEVEVEVEANNRRGLLKELLTAQLQHSQGIRGFFVSFLTAGTFDDEEDGTTNNYEEEFTVPDLLLQSMTEGVISEDDALQGELLSFACMNVVMPTATAVAHTEPVQVRASLKTAVRAIQVLSALKGSRVYSDDVLLNCKAIRAAAGAGDDVDADVDAGLFKVRTYMCGIVAAFLLSY